MLQFLFLDGLFETIGELNFVVRIIVFSYLLFWFYITFQETQILFGLGGALAGYLIFLHGISIMIVVALFFIFIVFGMQLQMIFQFGVYSLLGIHEKMGRQQQEQQEAIQTIQQKIQAGTANSEEKQWLMQQHVSNHLSQGNQLGEQGLMRRQA
ncbi:MAG: hypothetical protein ABH803_01325 [Candidatus Micrarchaeota archaeon]